MANNSIEEVHSWMNGNLVGGIQSMTNLSHKMCLCPCSLVQVWFWHVQLVKTHSVPGSLPEVFYRLAVKDFFEFKRFVVHNMVNSFDGVRRNWSCCWNSSGRWWTGREMTSIHQLSKQHSRAQSKTTVKAASSCVTLLKSSIASAFCGNMSHNKNSKHTKRHKLLSLYKTREQNVWLVTSETNWHQLISTCRNGRVTMERNKHEMLCDQDNMVNGNGWPPVVSATHPVRYAPILLRLSCNRNELPQSLLTASAKFTLAPFSSNTLQIDL